MYVCLYASTMLVSCMRSPITGLSLRDVYCRAGSRTREMARQGALVLERSVSVVYSMELSLSPAAHVSTRHLSLVNTLAKNGKSFDVTRGRFVCVMCSVWVRFGFSPSGVLSVVYLSCRTTILSGG